MLFAVHTAAVDADKRITQYAHIAWRTRDGFFSGSPRAITQTTDGYIWIATQSELFQFDGVRLMKWTPSAGGQFPSSKINALLGSSDGSLWIGTDSGVAQWKNQQLTMISGSQARITSIIERASGEIWFSSIPLSDQTGGICRVSGQQAQCFGPRDGIPLKSAAVLSEDRSGSLWFGDQSKVVQWDGSSVRIFAPPALIGNQADGLRGMVAASDGSVWLGFNTRGPGVGLQNVVGDGLKTFVTHELDSSTLEVTTLLLDRQNSVWVGTISQGIFRIHGAVVDHYGSADGLSSDYILQLYEDREGDVWAATSRGIDCFRDLRVTSYTRREGLPSEEVDSVLASRDGTIWAGGPAGLSSIRGRTVTSIPLPHFGTRTQVTSLFEDHAGRIWVGVENSLYVYDRGIFHSVIRPDGRQPGFVLGLAEDQEHHIWAEISAPPRALLRISNLVVDREFREPEMPAARKVAIAPDGSLWLGLLTGDLARYKGGKTDILRFKNSPTPTRDSAVNEVVVATDGSVLGATSFGLIAWKNGTQQTMTTKNGLPCDAIYSAVTDRRGTLWLYAQCGIVGVANAELEKWWKDRNATLQVRTIGPLDGAQPGPVPFQGAAASPDGRVWFANFTALQVFDTSDTSRNSIPPPVYIQDIVAEHKIYGGNANIWFPAGTRDLQIDYTALSFRNPQKVAFRYRLEGRDNTWQDAGSRRQAFYTDLPPGQYRFQVIASNNDGVWNDQGAMLAFSIAPAWYQTKIFKFGCILFAVLLVWTIHRVRVRQVAQAIGTRFDERLAERTRIARDLHDTLLQTIQGSKLVADDALERSSDPGRMRKALEQLSTWLQQAGQEGRAALNSLRVSATTTNDLAEAFKRVLETAPIDSLAATITVSGDVRDIHPIVRDEVYRVGYEAIRNAHAHSGGNHLEVQLRYAADLTLRITDNGTGADASTFSAGKEGHYGVKGMRERAIRIGARLSIVSHAARGTEVCLIVPGRIAFREASDGKVRGGHDPASAGSE
jgi:signal transduction histidine kinase/ligand-binding sensor domain-containing protein